MVLPEGDRVNTAISKKTLEKVKASKPSNMSLRTYVSVLVEQALQMQQQA